MAANLGRRLEKARTWSVGADLDIGTRLRVSTTYFNVKYTNQVEAHLPDFAILSREAQFAGTGIIPRGAAAAMRVAELQAQGIGVTVRFPIRSLCSSTAATTT